MGWVGERPIPDHLHSSSPPGPAGRCFLRKILRTSSISLPRYSQCHTAGALCHSTWVAELAALALGTALHPPRKTLRPTSLPALTPAHLLCLTSGFLGMHSPCLADLPSPPSRAPALVLRSPVVWGKEGVSWLLSALPTASLVICPPWSCSPDTLPPPAGAVLDTRETPRRALPSLAPLAMVSPS